MSESLGNKSRRGFAWDMLGTAIRQVSTLIVTVILARILEPEQFGVIGMAMVFVSLAQVFIDVGFVDGIIQKKNIDGVLLSSVFYVNIGISIVLSIFIYFGASVIGNFYNNQEVEEVIRFLALIPFIASLGRVQAAILVREMRFKVLTIRDISATVIGGAAGITAAFLNQGVLALVWQQIITLTLSTTLMWFGSEWKPTPSLSLKKIRDLLSFSSYVFFDRALRYFFQKVDTLFIGKVFSAATLGFYSRAESLNAQVVQYSSSSLGKVIFPALSSLQNDRDSFHNIFLKVFKLAAFVGVISSGTMYFLSAEIIIGLLGAKWEPSVVIFQIFVFRLLISPLGPLMGKSMLAMGYSKKKFHLSQLQRILLLFPLPVGYYYGIEAFVITLVLANFIGLGINMFVFARLFKFSVTELLLTLLKPMFPLIILIISFSLMDIISSIVEFGIFLVLQFVYSYLSKDEGAAMLYQEGVKIVKKVATNPRITF